MNTGTEGPPTFGPPVHSSTRRRYQRRCSVTEASLRTAQKLLEGCFCDDDVVDHVPVSPCSFPPVSVGVVGGFKDPIGETLQTDARARATSQSTADQSKSSYVLPDFPLLASEVKEDNSEKNIGRGISMGFKSCTPSIRLSSKRKIPELTLPMKETLLPSTQPSLSMEGHYLSASELSRKSDPALFKSYHDE